MFSAFSIGLKVISFFEWLCYASSKSGMIMSGIYDWSMYIGLSESEYVSCLKIACKQLKLPLFLKQKSQLTKSAVPLIWSATTGGVAVRNPSPSTIQGVALRMKTATLLKANWLWAQDYQRHVWYYYLYRENKVVDAYHVSKKFCQIEEWDEDFLKSNSPEYHADLLAKTCGVSPARIQKYFRDWGYKLDGEDFQFTVRGKGKAYPEDRHEYGDGYQLWDFLNKLGFEEPTETRGYYLNQE